MAENSNNNRQLHVRSYNSLQHTLTDRHWWKLNLEDAPRRSALRVEEGQGDTKHLRDGLVIDNDRKHE
ncbi:Hypothetical predicted protein [Xyrichtys novacula]|uniref:Uncharacterized protein n=1 Tax=Xyrichtys novacula TaxID=13765 RepID=A0AAV1FEQ1_XYRNO|nr:Hypothetical predicted protein [Xyrichtys novacula]